MRRLPLASLLLSLACAAPRPCTRTLCVTKLSGAFELSGWSGVVRETAESPKPPIISDSTVTILDGAAEFINGRTRVTATAGSAFRFSVSSRAIAQIEVSSGLVTVEISTAAPLALTPGISFSLPKP